MSSKQIAKAVGAKLVLLKGGEGKHKGEEEVEVESLIFMTSEVKESIQWRWYGNVTVVVCTSKAN